MTHAAMTISRNLIIGTASEKSAQGRYPSTIGGPRSPTSHQEKEAWMVRTRRNDSRWTRLVQEWYPIGEKQSVGRPRMR
uniref:Uncharacterized protein n=1 Tax=Caenorhabditis japonica TaxID=281687 RepID=A0A8R1E465_CAEJA